MTGIPDIKTISLDFKVYLLFMAKASRLVLKTICLKGVAGSATTQSTHDDYAIQAERYKINHFQK